MLPRAVQRGPTQIPNSRHLAYSCLKTGAVDGGLTIQGGHLAVVLYITAVNVGLPLQGGHLAAACSKLEQSSRLHALNWQLIAVQGGQPRRLPTLWIKWGSKILAVKVSLLSSLHSSLQC
jgi:hypothetical protein